MKSSSTTSAVTVAMRRPPSNPVRNIAPTSTTTIDSLYQALRKEVLITAREVNQALSHTTVVDDDLVMKLAVLILACPAPMGNEVEVKLPLNDKQKAIIDRAIPRAGLIDVPAFCLPETIPSEKSSVDDSVEDNFPVQLSGLLFLLLRGCLILPSPNELKMVGYDDFKTADLRQWIRGRSNHKKLLVAWHSLEWFAAKKIDVSMCKNTGDIFVCFEEDRVVLDPCIWVRTPPQYLNMLTFLNVLNAKLAIHSDDPKQCVSFLSRRYFMFKDIPDPQPATSSQHMSTVVVSPYLHQLSRKHEIDTRSALPPSDKHDYQRLEGDVCGSSSLTDEKFAVDVMYVDRSMNRQVDKDNALRKTRGQVYFKLQVKHDQNIPAIHASVSRMLKQWCPNATEKDIGDLQVESCLHAVRSGLRGTNTIHYYHDEEKKELTHDATQLLSPLTNMVVDYASPRTEALVTWKAIEDRKLTMLSPQNTQEKKYDDAVKYFLCSNPQQLKGQLSAEIMAKYAKSAEPWKQQCVRFLAAQKGNDTDAIKLMAKAEDYLPAVSYLINEFKRPDEHIRLQLYLHATRARRAWLLERKGVSYDVIPVQLRPRLFEESRNFIAAHCQHPSYGPVALAYLSFLNDVWSTPVYDAVEPYAGFEDINLSPDEELLVCEGLRSRVHSLSFRYGMEEAGWSKEELENARKNADAKVDAARRPPEVVPPPPPPPRVALAAFILLPLRHQSSSTSCAAQAGAAAAAPDQRR